MVVNKGFSFSNFVDQYKIETIFHGTALDMQGELVSVLSEDEIYQRAEIVSVCSDNKLTEIYSINSFNREQSIAFEFSNINIFDYASILEFCNKYGSLYSDRLLRNNNHYDYVFMNRTKNSFAPAVPTRDHDTIYLSNFCESVIEMRTILNLISSLNQKDYVSMLLSIIFLSFHPTEKMYTWIDTPSGMEHQDFRVYFIAYNRAENFIERTFQEKINGYLLEIGNYLLYNESCPDNFDLDYDFVYSSFGQAQLSLFNTLKEIINITDVTEDGQVFYTETLSNDIICDKLQVETIVLLANAFILSMLNYELRNVYPEMRYEDGNLIGDWNISTLYEAMLLEVFLSFSPNNRLKKCANPTCNSFFEVGTGNDRKIYCSTRCAQLMAKRNQRERDKKKI